jgi:8-amino-7-oxononanoate synthase
MRPENWRKRLETEAERGLRRRLPDVGPLGPDALDCGSNDYLGLSRHPRVIEAARDALDKYGAGATASRLLRGNREIHEQLEQRLAQLKGTASALVYSSGYAANLGLLSAIADRDDTIFCDSLDHASLVDGARLARASLRFYNHGDPGHLERQLARRTGTGHAWIVTDGVFSMDGALARVPELLEVAETHDATMVIDDAHATGVLGPDGAGTLSHFGIDPSRAIQMGTLSKALAAQGGYVCGPQELVDLLVQSSRAFIYSTGLNPAAAAAALEALRVSVEEPEWRERLHANLARLRGGLREAGCTVYGDAPAPMCAVHVGEADEAVHVAARLAELGILAPAIRPPTVPAGTSRIRLAPPASFEADDLDRVIEAVLRATGRA